jgi:hypothetical protein
VSVSERCKSRAETPPIVSESRRTRRGRVETAMLHGRPLRVKAIQFPRRRFLHLAAGATALSAVSYVARAQTYPTRPITMIVPLAAGGISVVEGRVVAERMRKSLGQPIIIENVSGAEGSIGVGRVAHARPDGYTIAIGFLGTHVLNGAFYSLQYDVLNDFEPISPLTTTPGGGPERIDRLVEGQSQQGVGGNRHSQQSPPNCVVSKTNRDAIYPRAISWRRLGIPGLGGR